MRQQSKKTAKNKAWTWFAKYIKLRYADKLGLCHCVTCGKTFRWDDPVLHAGHFVSGRGNGVLFDEDLVRPQCAGCNIFGHGEQAMFAIYLKGWEGKSDDDIKEFLQRKHKIVKYSLADYIDIANKYKEKCGVLIEENKHRLTTGKVPEKNVNTKRQKQKLLRKNR